MLGTKRLARKGSILGVVVTGALLLTSCIEGPITGATNVPMGIDVTRVGYQQSEFFLGNYADAYTSDAPLTSDGRWDGVSVDAATSQVRFKTRLVVARPADPAKFNGTVIVEWLNVTAGSDLPNGWTAAHTEFVRSGAMWVGVSAQLTGVNQAKSFSPARYGSLDHPGDSYSYDIFTKAAKAIRTDRKVTGGLKPRRLIATGQSQSASRLVTYINAIQPISNAFNGFLVHSRGVTGSALSQSPLTAIAAPSPSLIRDDLDVPVFVVQAEDDVIRSNLAIRQADTTRFRQWELAGTAHADAYMSNVGFSDLGDGTGATRMFNLMRNPNPPPTGCSLPMNAGGLSWTLRAAFNHLDAWMRTGTPPPVGPLLQVESTTPTVLERDGVGNAVGGVRSPQVDTPVATVDGLNSGPGFCRLFGSTTPLTTAELSTRYGTSENFVNAWSTSLDELVTGGFLLQVDADELLVAAQTANILPVVTD